MKWEGLEQVVTGGLNEKAIDIEGVKSKLNYIHGKEEKLSFWDKLVT